MSYLREAATPLKTPQSEPIPGSNQVQNEAGGFAWQTDPIHQLRRWLILGSEGGTYYVSQRKLTRQNIDAVSKALDERPKEALAQIVEVSTEGLAPKQDQCIYALALACAHNNAELRHRALGYVPVVCRTGTQLFMFCQFVKEHRGWGRGLRTAIARWYEQDAEKLSYQLVKYRQRDGWTHRDVLRLAHPKPMGETHNLLFGWAKGRDLDAPVLRPIDAYLASMQAPTAHDTAAVIGRYGNSLPREAIQPEHLNSPVVWNALLEAGMPMTALIRNLATLTRVGVIAPFSDGTKLAVEQLSDENRLQRARVHPIACLLALATYGAGHGYRGKGEWTPVPQVQEALEHAFYASFKYVEPTGKRHLVAIDVSGSMTSQLGEMPMQVREAAAAMAMVVARTEKEYAFVGFSNQLMKLNITAQDTIQAVLARTRELPFGGTDCALPILYALEQGINVDVFVVITDNETWAGQIHPAQALKTYRRQSGIEAKLIVLAMTSSGFTIADPSDPGMLDVVGFDASAPKIMSQFAAGRI